MTISSTAMAVGQELEEAEEDQDDRDEIDKENTWDWAIESAADLRCVIASTKSYVGASVLTFALYWLFWFPGLIANVMYYKEAKRMEELANENLPGVGCLVFQLCMAVFWLVFLVLVVVYTWSRLRQVLPLP